MNQQFEKWADDYGLTYEPLTRKSVKQDCLAAYEQGKKDALEEAFKEPIATVSIGGSGVYWNVHYDNIPSPNTHLFLKPKGE